MIKQTLDAVLKEHELPSDDALIIRISELDTITATPGYIGAELCSLFGEKLSGEYRTVVQEHCRRTFSDIYDRVLGQVKHPHTPFIVENLRRAKDDIVNYLSQKAMGIYDTTSNNKYGFN